jgi:hypothetical protein
MILCHDAPIKCIHMSNGRGGLSNQQSRQSFRKAALGKRCWPHLQVHCLSQGGPRGHCRYPVYRGTPRTCFRPRKKGKVCVHALPCATTTTEPTTLLREGSDATTCPRLWIPPLHLGWLQRCHVPRGSAPHLAIQEGSGAAMHPSALGLATPLRRGLTLTCVHRL